MNRLHVHLDFGQEKHRVGDLFLSEKEGRYLFEYAPDFLGKGLSLSPYRLPLEPSVFAAERNSDLYDLHGVFADSLPDDWGRKVQDAEFQKAGHYGVTALDRLAFVGRYGLGALKYEPAGDFEQGKTAVRLADLRKATQRVLAGSIKNVTEALLHSGGSAGGARPKFLVDLDTTSNEKIRYTSGVPEGAYYPVLLKVPVRGDDSYQRIEFVYSQMASKAGIYLPDAYLLENEKKGSACFAIKRFDVLPDGGRLHAHTLAGLLGVNIRESSPDYTTFFRMTAELTRDQRFVTEAYKRMVFNHLSSNLDDHAKNITFTMTETGAWFLAPAYDLGYSTAAGGLHAMALNGKRFNLGPADYEKAAEDFNIKDWTNILKKTAESLGSWHALAKKWKVPERHVKSIGERIREQCGRALKRR